MQRQVILEATPRPRFAEKEGDVSALNTDTPRALPTDDRLGFAAHAAKLALSIADFLRAQGKSEDGASLVVSIEGPWGSGKSTYLNFVRHELGPYVGNRECVIVQFDPWWLSTGENLVLPFLSALGRALPQEARSQFAEAVSGLLRASRHVPDWLIALTHNAKGEANWLGQLLGAAKESGGSLEAWMSRSKSPRAVRDDAAKALREAKVGLVVIVDDIDRLEGREALDVLRFVKSIGDLPRVTYLLAFDRDALKDTLKGAGIRKPNQFLEKIVQTTVPLPPIRDWRMRKLAIEQLSQALKVADEELSRDERFSAAVVALLRKPRDLARLVNNVAIVANTIEGEADKIDFLCLQALRMFDRDFYAAIAANKALLTDDFTMTLMEEMAEMATNDVVREQRHRKALLLDADPSRRRAEIVRTLFPRCQLNKEEIGEEQAKQLEARRGIGLSKYFDTYFFLETSPGIMSRADAEALLAIRDPDRIVHELQSLRSDGTNGQSIEHLIDLLESRNGDPQAQNVTRVLYGRNADFLYFPDDPPRAWQLGMRVARLTADILRRDPPGFRAQILESTANPTALIASGPLAWSLARQRGLLGQQDDAEFLQTRFGDVFIDSEMDVFASAFASAVQTQAEHASIFQVPGAPRVLAAWRVLAPAAASNWARKLGASEEGREKFLLGHGGYVIADDTIEFYFGGWEEFDRAMRELRAARPQLGPRIDEMLQWVERKRG